MTCHLSGVFFFFVLLLFFSVPRVIHCLPTRSHSAQLFVMIYISNTSWENVCSVSNQCCTQWHLGPRRQGGDYRCRQDVESTFALKAVISVQNSFPQPSSALASSLFHRHPSQQPTTPCQNWAGAQTPFPSFSSFPDAAPKALLWSCMNSADHR